MASMLDDEELSIPASSSARRSHQHSQRHSQRRDREREQTSTDARSRQNLIERHHSIQQLGAYTILRTLGEGSFGKVKLAVHQGTRQQVAFKIINRKKLVTRDMAGRIEREIKYLSLLRHPHIIKL
jgi:carbon catabolite-derepressing protein kinase